MTVLLILAALVVGAVLGFLAAVRAMDGLVRKVTDPKAPVRPNWPANIFAALFLGGLIYLIVNHLRLV